MKTSKIITLLGIYAILLVVFRVYFTKSVFYLFMVWNLFLAVIPYVISNYLKQVNNKYLLYVLFPIWLIFLPNAAYIITDLVHLHQGTLMPIWFDLLLILSFAITGMLLFFISLNDVFLLIKQHFSIKKAWFLTVFVLFLSSFGIYLGRYLRWNSWDIMHRPQLLLNDIFTRIIHPTHHPKTWGITFGFGFLFLLGFIGFKYIYIHQKLKTV
jgi:uncharacterized membrane protein